MQNDVIIIDFEQADGRSPTFVDFSVFQDVLGNIKQSFEITSKVLAPRHGVSFSHTEMQIVAIQEGSLRVGLRMLFMKADGSKPEPFEMVDRVKTYYEIVREAGVLIALVATGYGFLTPSDPVQARAAEADESVVEILERHPELQDRLSELSMNSNGTGYDIYIAFPDYPRSKLTSSINVKPKHLKRPSTIPQNISGVWPISVGDAPARAVQIEGATRTLRLGSTTHDNSKYPVLIEWVAESAKPQANEEYNVKADFIPINAIEFDDEFLPTSWQGAVGILRVNSVQVWAQ